MQARQKIEQRITWRRNQKFVVRVAERSKNVGIRFAGAGSEENILNRNILLAIGIVAGDCAASGFEAPLWRSDWSYVSVTSHVERIERDELRRLAMASITIANIDDNLKQQLMARAAEHGHSLEFEAREILENALSSTQQAAVPDNLYAAIRAIVDPIGGIELEAFPRQPVREPPRFD